MPKLGVVLEKLFKKAGLDTTDATLIPIFANETEISEEHSTKLSTQLLNIEAAKSHPDVNKALRQSILSVADSKMDEIITEMGLIPGDDFVNNKNTYEKLGMLSKLVHEAGKKTGGGSAGKMTNQEWIDKEKEYQKQLKELKEGFTTKEKAWQDKEVENLTAADVKLLLTGKKYSLPKDMPLARKIKTAYDALQEKLTADGYKLQRNEAGKLVIVNKEGQPAYNAQNEELAPDTYIDAALAGDQLLAINDDDNDDDTDTSKGKEHIPGGGPKPVGNAAILAEIEQDIVAFK